MKVKHITTGLVSVMLMASCTVAEIKETTNDAWDSTATFAKENSTVVGVVVGAAVGYAVSGKSDKGLGVLAGALAGGLIGNQLGKYLNEQDRAELERHTLVQLNQRDQQSQTAWKSSQTSAAAIVKTGQAETKRKPVEIVKLKQVTILPDLSLMGDSYVTKSAMNVRYSPEITDNKVGGLRKGTEFVAVGKTANNWVLAAQNGITIGYVSASSKYIELASVQKTALREDGIDLDAIDDASVSAAIDMDGIDLDQVELDKTVVSTNMACRTVSYDVTSEAGEKGNASFDACKGADGVWELT